MQCSWLSCHVGFQRLSEHGEFTRPGARSRRRRGGIPSTEVFLILVLCLSLFAIVPSAVSQTPTPMSWGWLFCGLNGGVDAPYDLGVRGNLYSYIQYEPVREILSMKPVTEGMWNHLAAVYDHEEVKLYRDGSLQGADSGASASASYIPTLIGATLDHGSVSGRWRGWIDEVRFWSVPRTQAEIGQFMQTPLDGTEAGLIRYWDFHEGTGQTTGDSSPNGLHGTLGATGSPGDDDPLRVISGAPVVVAPRQAASTNIRWSTPTVTATTAPTITFTPTMTPTMTPSPSSTPTFTPWTHPFEEVFNGGFELNTGLPRTIPTAWNDAGNYGGSLPGAPQTYRVGDYGYFAFVNPFGGQGWFVGYQTTYSSPKTLCYDEIYQDIPVAVGAAYSVNADLVFDRGCFFCPTPPWPNSPETMADLEVDFAGTEEPDGIVHKEMVVEGESQQHISVGPFVAAKSPLRISIYGQSLSTSSFAYGLVFDNIELACHNVTRATATVPPGFAGLIHMSSVEASIDVVSNENEGEVYVSLYGNPPLNLAKAMHKFWNVYGLPDGTFSATLIFSYTDMEIPEDVSVEEFLRLWRSQDNGLTWVLVDSVVHPVSNTVSTADPVSSFSMWTIAAVSGVTGTGAELWELYK